MAKAVLGRGLSALIPDSYIKKDMNNPIADDRQAQGSKTENLDSQLENVVLKPGVQIVALSKIAPNPDQPRTHFDDEALEELSISIKEQGVIQPLIVKKTSGDKYELICGERRLKASKKAGLKEIPVVIKELSDEKLLEIALIENIQRQDLNAIEEALGYAKLYERGATHEEIAKKLGKSRTAVVNKLRLLKLPKLLLQLIVENKISEGHGRSLLAIPSEEYQLRLAKKIIEEQLSVRQTEDTVRKKTYQKRPAKKARKIDPQIADLESQIEHKIGTKVRILASKNKGKIEIRYFSLDELDRILSVLGLSID